MPILEEIKLLQDLGGYLEWDGVARMDKLRSKIGCRYRIDENVVKSDKVIVYRYEKEDPYKC